MIGSLKTKNMYLFIGFASAFWVVAMAVIVMLLIFDLPANYNPPFQGSELTMMVSIFFGSGFIVSFFSFFLLKPVRLLRKGYKLPSFFISLGILCFWVPVLLISLYLIGALLVFPPVGLMTLVIFSGALGILVSYFISSMIKYRNISRNPGVKYFIIIFSGLVFGAVTFFGVIFSYKELDSLYNFPLVAFLSFLGSALIPLGFVKIIRVRFKTDLRVFAYVISTAMIIVSPFVFILDIESKPYHSFLALLIIEAVLGILLNLLILHILRKALKDLPSQMQQHFDGQSKSISDSFGNILSNGD